MGWASGHRVLKIAPSMMPDSLGRAQGGGKGNGSVDPHAACHYPARVRSILFLTMALVATGCAATKGQERQVPVPLSDQHERIIGSRLATRFETGLRPEASPEVNDYLNQLGQRIARLSDRPEIPYPVRVFVSPEPRAVAFPGGKIYVSTGLLKLIDTECEAAGILGHEIAHVAARHPAGILERELDDKELAAILLGPRGADTTAAGAKALELLGAGYGQETERKADVTALLYLSRVGLNPDGMIQVMEKLNPATAKKEEFWEPLSGGQQTPAERILFLRTELKSMGLDAGLPRDLRPYAPIKQRLK